MDLQMQRAHGCARAAEAIFGRTFYVHGCTVFGGAMDGKEPLWLRFFFSQKEMSSPLGEKQTINLLKSLANTNN